LKPLKNQIHNLLDLHVLTATFNNRRETIKPQRALKEVNTRIKRRSFQEPYCKIIIVHEDILSEKTRDNPPATRNGLK
jgi:hypothetical protein